MNELRGITIPGDLDPKTHERVVTALRRRTLLLGAEEPTREMLAEAVHLTEVVRDLIDGSIEARARAKEAEAEVARVTRLLRIALQRIADGEHTPPPTRRYALGGPVAEAPAPRPEDCPIGYGSLSGYSNKRCRCAACTEASRVYQRNHARVRRARARAASSFT